MEHTIDLANDYSSRKAARAARVEAALAAECPRCKAKSGEPCRYMAGSVHTARIDGAA